MQNEQSGTREFLHTSQVNLGPTSTVLSRKVRFITPILMGIGVSVALGFGYARPGLDAITNSENAGGTDSIDNLRGSGEFGGTAESSEASAAEPRLRTGRDVKRSGPISTFGWTDARCNNCHQPEKLFSHPVGVVPSLMVPESFPLVRGKIECITCHASEVSGDHADAREQHTALLRGEMTGENFCTNCHQPSGAQRRDMHAQGAGRAHLRWSKTARSITFAKGGQNYSITREPVDEKQDCISCHDGVIASSALHNTGGSRSRDSRGRTTGHPSGVPYAVSGFSSTGSDALLPEGRLDDRIRLFNGTMDCRSCHSLYSGHDSLLVMSNRGSRLCFSCHNL